MNTREKLLLESKAWAREKILLDKNYFKRLSGMHNPDVLWIGSSDSLVPVMEVTNTEPGQILVYRNMANQVRQDDLSFMALLQDALDVAKVDLIVVCGYSHCGGIRDVLQGTEDRPYVQQWLSGLKDLYARHIDELKTMTFDSMEHRLSELNIKQQIINLSNLEVIQHSWEKRSAPLLLGWYFDLNTGELTEVFRMDPGSKELNQVSNLQDK